MNANNFDDPSRVPIIFHNIVRLIRPLRVKYV